MKNRRFKKYIDRKFQGKIAMIVIVNALIYMLLLALFIFTPLAYRMENETLSSEIIRVGKDYLSLHEHVWPAILLLLVLVGFQSIRVSHRVAGPVYGFKAAIKSIRMRNLSDKLALRKGDFLYDLMEEINEMRSSLREAVQELKNKDDTLRGAIKKLNGQLAQEDISPDALKESALRVCQSEEALRLCLEDFQLEKEKA
ncbi:MAG: hypothetical protein ACE5F7_03965 [Nitrospiria bacterium]